MLLINIRYLFDSIPSSPQHTHTVSCIGIQKKSTFLTSTELNV